MYINITTLEQASRRQIKQANPNVSLSRNPTDAQLASLGYANLQPTEQPEGDVVTEGTPEQHTDGTWHQTWDVRDYTPEEAAEALEQAKARKTHEINDAYNQQMSALVKEYPETERESWSKQEREARDWLADNTAPTPFMDAVLLVRTSTTKTQLANRIITKSDALADATGQLTGKRHVKEAEIEAAYLANDQTALENITW